MPQRVSAFEQYEPKGYPYKYRGHAVVECLGGGTPTNPDVAEAWLKAKGYGGAFKDDLLRSQVTEVMSERGIDENAAIEVVSRNRHLTGFKRDENGLYIEGRQLKACVKEACSVAADVGKMKQRALGQMNSRKGILSFVAEHVFVVEQRLPLGVMEPTDVHQSFVHTFRGSGIQLMEVVTDAEFDFTIETDHQFSEGEWAMIWGTAQRQGVGAARSQGYGRFVVVTWEPLSRAQRQPKVKSLPKRKAA